VRGSPNFARATNTGFVFFPLVVSVYAT
jgi:hypothetical protein